MNAAAGSVTAAASVAPAPLRDTPVRSVAAQPAEGDAALRSPRPGSLLDIRV